MQEYEVHYSHLSGHGFFTMTIKAESQSDEKRIALEILDTGIFKLI